MKIRQSWGLLVGLFLAACVPAAPLPTPTPDPVAVGQEVYGRVCAECHGEETEGHAAPALDGSEHTWLHSDYELQNWIKNGKFGMVEMPAFRDELADSGGRRHRLHQVVVERRTASNPGKHQSTLCNANTANSESVTINKQYIGHPRRRADPHRLHPDRRSLVSWFLSATPINI